MNCWQDLPKELQLRDAELASLSLQDCKRLFTLAREMGIVKQFAELFWDSMNRVRCNPNRASVQQCVDFLEERKRTLGRAVNYKYNSPVAKLYLSIRYNECEYNIRWLVEQYECSRKTKPYLLEV